MTTAFLLKILIILIGILGTFFISLFFYFLNSFNTKIIALSDKIQSVQNQLSKKLDDLKERYFQDVAGFGKIFVFQQTLDKTERQLMKRIEKIEQRCQRTVHVK